MGSALPALSVDNERLTTFLDTSDEWITTRTGIKSRQILTNETLLELGAKAARAAMEDSGVRLEDIDLLICSTVKGDQLTPSLGCMLQKQVGVRCAAFDVNGACPGFIYSLDMADAYITSGKARNVLIVCAEGLSRMCDWTDRSTCVLFGDGAAAVVVGEGEGLINTYFTLESSDEYLYAYPDPGNSPFIQNAHPLRRLYMNGQRVYRFAVSHAAEDIIAVCQKCAVPLEDIDYFVLHQANKRILEAARARLKQPEEKFPHNIEARGNTASASIPILLDEMYRAGRLKKGQLLALSAFGAGLTTGAAILRWTKD